MAARTLLNVTLVTSSVLLYMGENSSNFADNIRYIVQYQSLNDHSPCISVLLNRCYAHMFCLLYWYAIRRKVEEHWRPYTSSFIICYPRIIITNFTRVTITCIFIVKVYMSNSN